MSKGTSQEQIARDAGVATATLRKIESGEVANPGFFTVLSLAAALDMQLTELSAAGQEAGEVAGGDRPSSP